MKNRHSVEQIIRILGEIERAGLKIPDACRPHGISEQAYHRWRNKYGGMEISEARRLKELEAENGRLKKLVADLRGRGIEKYLKIFDLPMDKTIVTTICPPGRPSSEQRKATCSIFRWDHRQLLVTQLD